MATLVGEGRRSPRQGAKTGAGDSIVGESMVLVRECQAHWFKAMIDRDELA